MSGPIARREVDGVCDVAIQDRGAPRGLSLGCGSPDDDWEYLECGGSWPAQRLLTATVGINVPRPDRVPTTMRAA